MTNVVSSCSIILVLVTVVVIAVNDVAAVVDTAVVIDDAEVEDNAVVVKASSKRNLRGVPGACFLRKGIPRRA